jgi:hypothetical protein
LDEISQGKAAEIADLIQSKFINALSRFKVSPWQYIAQELTEKLASAATRELSSTQREAIAPLIST